MPIPPDNPYGWVADEIDALVDWQLMKHPRLTEIASVYTRPMFEFISPSRGSVLCRNEDPE